MIQLQAVLDHAGGGTGWGYRRENRLGEARANRGEVVLALLEKVQG